MNDPQDMPEILKHLLGICSEEKLGKELKSLAPEEIARFEALSLKAKDLIDQVQSIQLDLQDNDIQRKKWWREIERKYKLDGNMTIRDGKVFELIR